MEGLKRNFNVLYGLTLIGLAVANGVTYSVGYQFVPVNYLLFFVLYAAAVIGAAVFSVREKLMASKASGVFGVLMPAAALTFIISLAFCLEMEKQYVQLYFDLLFAFTIVSSLVIFFGYVKRGWIRWLVFILSVLAAAVFLRVFLFSLVFGQFSTVELYQKYSSPTFAYSAWVQRRDEGALGGSTGVFIRKEHDIFIGLGTFQPRERCIRTGDYGAEYRLDWKDDSTLVVNDIEYNIPHLLQTSYTNRFGVQIAIPNRAPDYMEDTHGGFLGDGNCTVRYHLTEQETALIERDIQYNGNWKLIDRQAAAYLYGGQEGYYSDGFALGKLPALQTGYYCFFDKQKSDYSFPQPNAYSHNYVLCQYSPEERTLFVYEQDT